MNLHKFKIDEPAVFQEAVGCIEWDKVSELLQNNYVNSLHNYLYDHFEAYYETTQDQALDRHVDDQIDEGLQRRAEFDSGFGDFVKKTFS